MSGAGSDDDGQEEFIYDSSSEDDDIQLEVAGIDGSEPTAAVTERMDMDDFPHTVLSADQIVEDMVQTIREVNQIVQIPATTTRILLNHFKWDKEKLMERYYGGDQERLFKEAHVINPYTAAGSSGSSGAASSSTSTAPPHPTSDTHCSTTSCVASTRSRPSKRTKSSDSIVECGICMQNMQINDMTGLECAHRFCTQCWAEYLTTKIMSEGMGQTISCAAHRCDILVDDQTVMRLIRDPKVKFKYQQLITSSFVQCNRLMKWCPAPDCQFVIKVQYVDAKPVTCKCGYNFCFQCLESWHDPVQCRWLKKWGKKCDDDSETSNWIAANTKECPKCNVTIEKDGGCNHMICKNVSCKAEFCWVCIGPWEPHGSSWYNCNRYNENDARIARDAQDKSRTALHRYLFYYNRYMNHMQSLKFEHKLYASIKSKMEEMQAHSHMSWIEVQFLKQAVDVLCQCRVTLMHTYVFAFFLNRNNQSIIFEDNQKDVEVATETLSEYLERDITLENMADIKQKVQDKYRYCESRRKVLLEHVYEGYEKEWWEYIES